ncbi:hypothetical protein TKK_0010006 [Trichogramma kaykai]
MAWKRKLDSGFMCWNFAARREKKKGRASGGILIGIRKEWIGGKECEAREVSKGVVKVSIREEMQVYAIYNQGNLREVLEYFEKQEEVVKGKVLIGGDFNMRIGEGGKRGFKEGEERKRNSKDKKVSNEGKFMLEVIGRKGWRILNGNAGRDEEGEYTYTGGRGASVIDYVIVNEEAWWDVTDFAIGERTESDHQSLEVVLCSEESYVKKKEERKVVKVVSSWNEEDIVKFQDNIEEEMKQRTEDRWTSGSVESNWEEIKDIVNKSVVKKEIAVKKWRVGHRKWWDRECGREKRKVKSMYLAWRQERGSKENYLEQKRKSRRLCMEKEKSSKEREEAALRSLKNEEQIWKFLGRRKGRTKIECNIKSSEWRRSFMDLLEGTEECQKGEKRKKVQDEGEKIGEEELKKIIDKLKKRKAPGVDGIQNEAWSNAGMLRKKLKNLLDGIWKGEEIPEDWKTAIIVPLCKKGDVDNPSNYRGISLLPTAYKIYTEVIRGRFPSNEFRKMQWLSALGITKASKHACICSDHFEADDLYIKPHEDDRRHVTDTAVPSRNLKIQQRSSISAPLRTEPIQNDCATSSSNEASASCMQVDEDDIRDFDIATASFDINDHIT